MRAALGILVLAACAGPGGPAPRALSGDFSLRTLDGRRVTLSEQLGRGPVLLDFWATWCHPCQEELGHLERLHRRFGAAGLRVLGIAIDGPQTRAQVGAAARRHGLSFPVLLDEEGRAMEAFDPRGTAPYVVLLDRRGRVARTLEGYTPGDEAALEEAVVRLLGQPR